MGLPRLAITGLLLGRIVEFIDFSERAPFSLLGIFMMIELAAVLFGITVALQRKRIAHRFAIGIALLPVPILAGLPPILLEMPPVAANGWYTLTVPIGLVHQRGTADRPPSAVEPGVLQRALTSLYSAACGWSRTPTQGPDRRLGVEAAGGTIHDLTAVLGVADVGEMLARGITVGDIEDLRASARDVLGPTRSSFSHRFGAPARSSASA